MYRKAIEWAPYYSALNTPISWLLAPENGNLYNARWLSNLEQVFFRRRVKPA
jgi:hypothetical protein